MTVSIDLPNLFVGLFCATLLGAGPLLAAGKHEGGHGHGAGGHAFDFGQPGKAEDVTRTVDIEMQDNLFEPKSITVKVGATVRFHVRNTGEAVHEFGIGTKETHAAHRPQMAMMMEHGIIEVDRINYERMKMDHGDGRRPMTHDDPNSVLVEPGGSAEILWTFTKSMTMEFACNIPGHYESGMVGDIVFE